MRTHFEVTTPTNSSAYGANLLICAPGFGKQVQRYLAAYLITEFAPPPVSAFQKNADATCASGYRWHFVGGGGSEARDCVSVNETNSTTAAPPLPEDSVIGYGAYLIAISPRGSPSINHRWVLPCSALTTTTTTTSTTKTSTTTTTTTTTTKEPDNVYLPGLEPGMQSMGGSFSGYEELSVNITTAADLLQRQFYMNAKRLAIAKALSAESAAAPYGYGPYNVSLRQISIAEISFLSSRRVLEDWAEPLLIRRRSLSSHTASRQVATEFLVETPDLTATFAVRAALFAQNFSDTLREELNQAFVNDNSVSSFSRITVSNTTYAPTQT